MNQSATKILVISPHPDDGILGCGGTIARLIEEGYEIHYVILSWAEQDFNREEIKNAVTSLGIKEGHLQIMDFQVRNFPYLSSAIRDRMVSLRKTIKPNLVFIHNSFDIHQDHEVTSKEGFRVFRENNLLGYILPWNIRNVRFDKFYKLEERHIEKKLKALKLLNSQQWRFYYKPEKVKALAIATGLFRRIDYAESFEVLSSVV